MTACPCGSGSSYDDCCGPLLRREREAATPEQLMRSRYTAYVRGDGDHLFRSWHPRTRPDDVPDQPDAGWRGLTILDAPPPDGDHGEVSFVAEHAQFTLRERSRFERRRGRWVYVDGDLG